MDVIESISEMREWRGGVAGSVGLVPTMGCLHDGHGHLLERARGGNDRVVMSLFVNPLQFRREAFEVYPRRLDEDLKLAEGRGVDAVFVPSVEEMYAELGGGRSRDALLDLIFSIQGGGEDRDQLEFRIDRVGDGMGYIRVPARLAMKMDGRLHPWHFDGVATVVERLLSIVEPTRSYFGQKDIQQVAILDALNDWAGGVTEIVRVPVVRESDGVSASSRLVMLSAEQRSIAAGIARLLDELAGSGEGAGVHALIERFEDGVARLETGPCELVIDSVVCVDSRTIEGVDVLTSSTAVYCAYLIDGIRLAETQWVGAAI
ncbi:MAG: pantoate--beta-alanine ligase [Phycisphaerales bacterium]|nr:pantoate--beta-alanine ligase [Phycisphaerales bacterium]